MKTLEFIFIMAFFGMFLLMLVVYGIVCMKFELVMKSGVILGLAILSGLLTWHCEREIKKHLPKAEKENDYLLDCFRDHPLSCRI